MDFLKNIYKRFFGNQQEDIFWEEYFRFFEKKINRKTPLRSLNFIVLDTETSGLDFKKDKILSIAALSVKDFKIDIENRFEAFFYRENYKPNEDVKVHGILKKHLLEGNTEKEILQKFLAYTKNSIIVGHHIGFDIAIINQVLKSQFNIKLKNKTIDTAWLAKRVETPIVKGFNPSSLDDLCKEYNIPLGKRHTAAGDAFITALLFLKLLGRLEKRKITSYGDI